MSAARDLSRDVTYKPPPESKKGVSVRMPLSLLKQLDEIVDIWKYQATARAELGGNDDPESVNTSHVIVTLLESAVKGEFDLYGGRPINEEGWKRVRAAVKSGVEAAHKLPKK